MSNLTDRDHAAFAAVDDALRTYPLQPAPPTLSPAAMARIRAMTPAPRFSLAWIDYAISLFAGGMAGLVLLLWQSTPPLLVARMQTQFALWFQRYQVAFLWPALIGGVGMLIVALIFAVALYTRPRVLQT